MAEIITKDEVLKKAQKFLEAAQLMTNRNHRACSLCLTIYDFRYQSKCYCDFESDRFK